MKKIKNIAFAAALVPVVLLSSCSNDYLDRVPSTAMDTEVILNDPSLVPSTVVGTMSMMASASAWGRDLVVVGDVVTDLVNTTRRNQGTMQDIEQWIVTTNSTDAASFWAAPYQIAASAARTVEAAKRLLADSASLSDDEIAQLYNSIATSLTVKVFCEYTLAQYFCLDYNLDDNNGGKQHTIPGTNPTKVGIILLKDRALGNSEPANMSSLEDTYTFMEQEIADAINAYGKSQNTCMLGAADVRYYPSITALYMIQAKVHLAQHEYNEALQAAENALSNLSVVGANGELISSAENLIAAYGATPSSEDIWQLNYTSQDNLSANSLNTLFGSYGFSPTPYAYGLFETDDIRRALYSSSTGSAPSSESGSWCLKYAADDGVFNVPVLRVPELYLIKAECEAALDGNGSRAYATLYNNLISKRDTTVTEENFAARYPNLVASATFQTYPANGVAQGFLAGLMDEYARELLCEGQRWSFLRRNGIALSREGSREDQDFRSHFMNYPLCRFSYPVPFVEFSTQQWKDGRPVDLAGNPIPGQSKNWQTNAWDEANGNNYSLQVELPEEGFDYQNQNDRPGVAIE